MLALRFLAAGLTGGSAARRTSGRSRLRPATSSHSSSTTPISPTGGATTDNAASGNGGCLGEQRDRGRRLGVEPGADADEQRPRRRDPDAAQITPPISPGQAA